MEEFDPWIEGIWNEVIVKEGQLQGIYPCTLWGEVVHLEGASALGVFGKDYYAGGPALTVHQFGEGKAYYLATHGSDVFISNLMSYLCKEVAIQPILDIEGTLEVTQRQRADGRNIYFLLNHGEKPVEVILPNAIYRSLLHGEELTGRIQIAANDVVILLEEKDAQLEGI